MKIISQILVGIFIAALVLLAIYIFTGCMTPNRAERKLERIYQHQPDVTAHFTRDKFPCIKTKETHDTTMVAGDSILVEVPCPDFTPKTIHDTVHHPKIIYVPFKIPVTKEVINNHTWEEDSAKIEIANTLIVINKKIADTNLKMYELMHSSRNAWRKYCLIFGGILLLLLLATVAKLAAKISIPTPFH